MSNVLVTLKPITPYFFGGENTFGDGKITYFAHSNYLPQQTTLLGMLRHVLLLQNGLIGTDPVANNWGKLIGDKSFQRINGSFVSQFGAIQSISPVFISDGSNHFVPQALDWAFYKSGEKIINGCKVPETQIAPLIVDFIDNEDFVIYEESNCPVPTLMVNNAPYDPKYGLATLWVRNDGKENKEWKKKDGGFFVEHEQVGIHRKLNKKKGAKDEGDYFKKVSLTLDGNFKFAFFIDLNLPDGFQFNSRIITMGGERSVFEMIVETSPKQSFEEVFTENTFKEGHDRKQPVVVLLSNSYCESSLLDHCKFSINGTENFQNIKTEQKHKINYAALSKSGSSVSKTGENLTLLRRGSVLYPKDGKTEAITNTLKNKPFENIGYNNYLIIN